LAIAAGSLLDGIPESLVIGVSMIAGGVVSFIAVGAVFLSNIPEGLSSAAGMRQAGRPPHYLFGLWTGIASLLGLASLAGYVVFSHFSPQVISGATAVAILAMLADTMIPEAFAEAHAFSGLITVVGFLAAFVLAQVGAG
jgi:ZIP family zinc transporter